MSDEKTQDNKVNEDYYQEEEISEGDWMRPQVDMKEVAVVTGEEDEEVFWQQRAKLYRWAKEAATWKERGIGEAKLLRHKSTHKIRFLLRQEKTLKIVANHYVCKQRTLCELKPHVSSDRIWVWSVTDYSDGDSKLEQFALKFGQVESANEFKNKFNEAVEENAKYIKSSSSESTEKATENNTKTNSVLSKEEQEKKESSQTKQEIRS